GIWVVKASLPRNLGLRSGPGGCPQGDGSQMQRVRPCPAGLLPGSSSASDGPARLHRQHQRALLHSSRMSECPSIQALETGVTYRTSEEAKHVPPVFAILDQREHAI